MPTTAEYKTTIKAELGISAVNGIDILIDVWWESNSEHSGRLQYLLTKRDACYYLMNAYRTSFEVALGDDRVSKQQQFEHVRDMFDLLSSQIQKEHKTTLTYGTYGKTSPSDSLPDHARDFTSIAENELAG